MSVVSVEGTEVLVVDSDEKVRKGLQSLLSSAGMVPTLMADPEQAVLLCREKYFTVAVIDLDTPRVGEGLKLVGRINQVSPATVVMMMASRKTFEVAVAAFRAGASDVIVKSPEQVNYLKDRVVASAQGKKVAADNSRLVEDVLALHDELMRVLLDTYKKATRLEEVAGGNEQLPIDEDTSVLVVDDDSWMRAQLEIMLATKGGYRLAGSGSGGEALDLIGRERFQIALVRDSLPDLPGSMVVKAIKGQSPDTIALLYTHPDASGKGGTVEVTEGSRVIPFIPEFADPSQILERLDELREAFMATSRERRYLSGFRQQHFELLRRYAELKQKLQRASSTS